MFRKFPKSSSRAVNSQTESNSTTPTTEVKHQGKTMKTHALVFVLLLACTCLVQGTYENCCLQYTKEVKTPVKRRVVSYRVQKTDGGCNLSAIVFKLKKLKTFCGDPKEQWVQNLMKRVDKVRRPLQEPQ